MPTERAHDVNRLLPLRPADLLVLLVLRDGERHGYGVMKEVERQSDGAVRLEIGSLYRLISRMTTTGVIEAVGGPDPESDPTERRRYYRLTPLGRRVLQAEVHRLQSVVALAASKGLIGKGAKSR